MGLRLCRARQIGIDFEYSTVSLSSKQRFSNRVDNYIRYRPRYPAEIIQVLCAECGLTPDSVIADIGSGTGFLAELFLKHGNRVLGIEPNPEMRQAGERLLAGYDNFSSIDGAAESTTLADSSVDFVTAGQAFHWFDARACDKEFRRILRHGGWVVLVWNDRATDTPLLQDYENLLRKHGTDYNEVLHRNIDSDFLESFYGHPEFATRTFEYHQHLDFPGLKGRLLSSSYVPAESHPDYEPMIRALQVLFAAHEEGGEVDFKYETRMYWGHLATDQ